LEDCSISKPKSIHYRFFAGLKSNSTRALKNIEDHFYFNEEDPDSNEYTITLVVDQATFNAKLLKRVLNSYCTNIDKIDTELYLMNNLSITTVQEKVTIMEDRLKKIYVEFPQLFADM
jgi:hypothetical protein